MSLQPSEVFIWHENYKCMEQPSYHSLSLLPLL